MPAPSNVNTQGFFLIVADQPGSDAGGFDLDQRKEPAVFVPSRIRVVQDGEQWSAIIAYRNEAVRIVSVRRSQQSEHRCMKTPEFDTAFDKGEDITGALDIAKAQRPKRKSKRINIDCPLWMIEGVEEEADRLGVTRQSLIKIWLAERLEGSAETD